MMEKKKGEDRKKGERTEGNGGVTAKGVVKCRRDSEGDVSLEAAPETAFLSA